MPKFKTRPIEIEAMQCKADDWKVIEAWSGGKAHACGNWKHDADVQWFTVDTKTMANVTALLNDWIIKDAAGFTIYRPGDFAETYEPA